jgi:NAD(P)-dependent dehydrogenase (short-subunit alcohol dehydrogenase family)
MNTIPAFAEGACAVVTGAASGIGLAAAKRLASLGLNLVLADWAREPLEQAAKEVAALARDGEKGVIAVRTDVSRRDDVKALEAQATQAFGPVAVLMNNAGIQPGSAVFGAEDVWRRILDVNLWGVIHGCQVFAPAMIASRRPALIINTGSKQGVTTPPGDPAYNVSKAGIKVFTEQLQHELRNIQGASVSAHLLIPGFVYTPLTANGRTEKPAAAWTPEQTVDFMIEELARGTFYILCPDNDVSRPLDERRIAWAAGDIVENRPPLSRWHPDYAAAFAQAIADL